MTARLHTVIVPFFKRGEFGEGIEQGASAIIQADGEEVRLGPDGPAAASCTCPTHGVCQQKLAAVLLLQSEANPSLHRLGGVQVPADGAIADTSDSGETTAGAVRSAALAEILALTKSQISKWAGKATLRAAAEILAGNSGPDVLVETTAVLVRLAPDLPEVRYLAGQGLTGMLSKAPKSRRKALHTAAILAIHRQHGTPVSIRYDDPALWEEASETQPAGLPDGGFLTSVSDCLEDCARTGLGLAPQVPFPRWESLKSSCTTPRLPETGVYLSPRPSEPKASPGWWATKSKPGPLPSATGDNYKTI